MGQDAKNRLARVSDAEHRFGAEGSGRRSLTRSAFRLAKPVPATQLLSCPHPRLQPSLQKAGPDASPAASCCCCSTGDRPARGFHSNGELFCAFNRPTHLHLWSADLPPAKQSGTGSRRYPLHVRARERSPPTASPPRADATDRPVPPC